MIERLLLALALVVTGILLYWGLNRILLLRRARQALMLKSYKVGSPAILYFTSPDCRPCETVQTPALEDLASMYGERLQILRVDVTEQPNLAQAWGVLSIPTTFLIDAEGQARGINHGVASADRLRRQLEGLGERPRQASKTSGMAQRSALD